MQPHVQIGVSANVDKDFSKHCIYQNLTHAACRVLMNAESSMAENPHNGAIISFAVNKIVAYFIF